MRALAATLVNWDAVWKIVVAALIGGAGVVIAFGLVLLGLEGAKTARGRPLRLAHRSLTATCALLCVSGVAIGIYAMAEKPPSKATPKPAGTQPRAAAARTPN